MLTDVVARPSENLSGVVMWCKSVGEASADIGNSELMKIREEVLWPKKIYMCRYNLRWMYAY
jgi:hypothetical protein